MKYLAITCIILALICVLAVNGYLERGKEINRLENEKNNLVQTIEDYRNAEVETHKSIKQLRKALENSKDNLDWYNTPIPTDLLNVLQERHNRNRKN